MNMRGRGLQLSMDLVERMRKYKREGYTNEWIAGQMHLARSTVEYWCAEIVPDRPNYKPLTERERYMVFQNWMQKLAKARHA